ncbi:MAG: DUF3025 domain-containing protein [Burkholderiaceae bacterium]
MEIAGLVDVDWSKPWFAPFSDLRSALDVNSDWRAELNRIARKRGICNHRGQHITFGSSDAAGREPYEAFIARTGCVPTRANLHDIFNALVWLRFPKLKAELNRLQASSIACDGVGAARGAMRDALTLIDENAVLLVTRRADLVDLLRGHQWTRLFIDERGTWTTDVRVAAFGHALLKKLAQPYKAITAHAMHVSLNLDASLEQIDVCAADALTDRISPADLMPLPVLGIPGWWEQNNDPKFYSDQAVFRPANIRRARIGET